MQNCTQLSDAELLAILLGNGTRGKDVMTLSRELITECKSITGVLFSEPRTLFQKKGLGKAKIALLGATRELLLRVKMHELLNMNFGSSTDKEKLIQLLFERSFMEKRECFYLLNFDLNGNFLQLEQISKGSLNEVGIKIKDLIKMILDNSASSVLVSHNHPQGSANPSLEDWNLFEELGKLLEKLDIHLYDQWIVGMDGVFSCKESRLIFG
ncbi:MAG: JAB domain-containing protein [Leptospiraceae bacterium]|nr:JAB domain-containing protein [Leptospiraceae bacterium]